MDAHIPGKGDIWQLAVAELSEDIARFIPAVGLHL